MEYKGQSVGRKRIDFVIGATGQPSSVLLEIKAKGALEEVDFIQTLSYLKASGFNVGLLINFGASRLQIKRVAN